MKTKLLKYLLLVACLVPFLLQSQTDSLLNELSKENRGVEKFGIYHKLIRVSVKSDSTKYKQYKDEAWKIVEDLNNDSLRLQMYIIEGAGNDMNRNDELRIEFVMKGIKLAEELKDSINLASLNYNLGAFYFWKQNPDLALKYMRKAMLSYPESGNPLKKANYTMAYGVVLQNESPEESVQYHEKALEIKRKAKAWKHIPISLNNLAELKVDLGDTLEGMEMLKESIRLSARYGIKEAEIYAEFVLGKIYNDKKEYAKALSLISKSVQWWEENNWEKDLPRAYKEITRSFTGVGDHRAAAKIWKKYVALSEKLFEKDRLNSIQELETKYETEKKEIALAKEKQEKDIAQRKKDLAEKETELVKSNERTRLILFSIIGLLLVGGGLYVYALYRKQKKDKNTIAEQKIQLEVRNKEVEDSIKYAKRIQSAILPPPKQLNESLPEHFVFYKPKDIIAGDFYWMEVSKVEEQEDNVAYESNEHFRDHPDSASVTIPILEAAEPQVRSSMVLLAAADCTGHGVPGAMVSVVCNNGLNRSVREFGLKDPGKILDKTRELVIQEFEKSEDEVKDGMDIALVSLLNSSSLSENQEADNINSKLSYAGANNPLWIIRKGADRVEEIKADKQPIGRYHQITPFTSHELKLNSGDTFYLFSDGFCDQFGGEKGKKMKAANFKKLLLEISNHSMSKQRELLEDAFSAWKGDLEQLDDVCVIGVRV